MKAYSVLEKTLDKKEARVDFHLVCVCTSLEEAKNKVAELIDKGCDAFMFIGHLEEAKDHIILE